MTPAPCNLCKCVGSHLCGNRREVLPSINANVVLVPPGPCVRGISGFWQHDFACFFNYFFIFHPFFSALIDWIPNESNGLVKYIGQGFFLFLSLSPSPSVPYRPISSSICLPQFPQGWKSGFVFVIKRKFSGCFSSSIHGFEMNLCLCACMCWMGGGMNVSACVCVFVIVHVGVYAKISVSMHIV